ncbi:MAG: alkaline phosphatase PhoX [Microcystaceae cyanobacterium]
MDNLYFTGEETNGGTQFVLNADSVDSAEGGALWAVPEMGRGGWENVTPIDSGDPTKVALLLGDDRQGAPLYLYVGEKNALNDNSFLDRNGLAQGTLYAWQSDTGETTPADFNGTGGSLTGNWVEILNEGAINGDDSDGFDGDGYATQDGLDTQTGRAALLDNTIVPGLTTQDVFLFSRPEDVATNPFDGSQVVMSSTGRSNLFSDDSWGTTYIIDVDVDNLTGDISILYDGDDADKQDFGLRSPDNLDWADDGHIYVQEDRSFSGFCQTTGEEASIWKLDPTSPGSATRIAQLDRSVVVPVGVTDSGAGDCGNWESSGILDVTDLFDTKEGEKLFIFDVQAHGITDGIIASADLVEGGQLIFLSNTVPEPGTVLGLGLFGLGAIAAKRKK